MNTKNIIITSLISLIFFTSMYTQRTITGKVSDTEGLPLIGANVLVKGTTIGTLTDIDGNYSIDCPDGGTHLEFYYIGFIKQEIEILGQKRIDVTLHEGQIFDEVVIVAASRKDHKVASDKRSPNKVQIRASIAGSNKKEKYSPSSYVAHGCHQPIKDQSQNWNTEDYSQIQENKFRRPTDEALSTFSIDVDRASYSNVRRFLDGGSMPPIDAVRIEEMINYFDYEYSQPEDETPFAVHTTLTKCPWNSDNQILHIGVQGKKIPTENLPPSNLVFLIDVSGSMNSPNKLGLLKSSFKLLTNNLRDEDRVAIVVYAGSAGLVLPPTKGSDKATILEALDNLRAGGSTAGGAGIKLAYKTAKEYFIAEGNNRVILATDGDFNIGASSDAEMVRLIESKRDDGIFLSVLGFGMGNYKDNKMQELADNGNGNHAYIDNLREARKVFVHEFGGTLFTIAKDVKIQIEFNPSQVAGYRLIGYENRMLNKEDFNDDTKDAGELGSGHVVTAMYEIIPEGTKSDYLVDVDDLKYQDVKSSKKSNELATIKLRYKKPDGDKSRKIERIVTTELEDDILSDVEFAMCVAEFGLLLRNSEFKNKSNYDNVITRAKQSKGNDENGYRSEFINLVRDARDMDIRDMAEK